MASRWICGRAPLQVACVLLVALAGCSKKTTAPTPEAEPVNSIKPTSNARITSQAVLGDADKKSILNDIRRADDGSIGFRGAYNGQGGVGVLNANGSLRWFRPLNYLPRDILALPVTAIVSHGLVVVGAKDTDSDGNSDLGYASLYSSSGNLMSELTVSSPGEARFLNRLTTVSDSAFIACGAARPSGVERPFLLPVNLKSPGTIQAGAEATLTGLTGSFSRIVLLAPPSLEVALAAISVDGTSRRIQGLRAPWPTFEPVAVEWAQAIAPPSGEWIQIGDLAVSGGNLYLVGSARDNSRPVDAGGNPWSSGVAASYTSVGDPRWIKTINISPYSDQLFAVAAGPTTIYAVGNAAFYIHANTDLFGYGLVTKLDPGDGHTIATFTMGDEGYSSGFYAAEWTGGALICGGWTLDDLRTGPYRGWLSTLDVSGTSPAKAVPSPIAGAARAIPAELEFGPGRASESH